MAPRSAPNLLRWWSKLLKRHTVQWTQNLDNHLDEILVSVVVAKTFKDKDAESVYRSRLHHTLKHNISTLGDG